MGKIDTVCNIMTMTSEIGKHNRLQCSSWMKFDSMSKRSMKV